MAMSLGGHTLTYYPSNFTPPRPVRSNAYLETMDSVAHFSWGFFYAGRVIDLEWNYMPSEEFDDLDAVFQQDEQVVWDPGIPDLSATYNVQILDFNGEFHEAVGSATEIWRRNCKMSLLIISQNPESS